MPHFFVSPENISEGRFVFSSGESAHLARVLRKKTGEEILLFDGAHRSYRGVLESVSPSRVTGRILAALPATRNPYFLRLFQAVPKGDTFEWILEKATELGAAEIVPLQTKRSVARVPPSRVVAKGDRWEKIVRAASAQCGRSDVPRVGAPVELGEALAGLDPSSVSLLPWEGELERNLKSFFKGLSPSGKGAGGWEGLRLVVNVFIGPEGGFDPQEVARARLQGVVSVSLGPRILRTETAGLFVAASLLYEYGL